MTPTDALQVFHDSLSVAQFSEFGVELTAENFCVAESGQVRLRLTQQIFENYLISGN